MPNIAINGFGRIGRCVLRALHESGATDINVVAINDLAPNETLAHAFEFDSVHGRFGGKITLGENTMDIGMGPMRMTAERAPENLDWSDVDVALDCTGIFTNDEGAARHLQSGAKKVVISAPGKGSMKTIVYGVNHQIIGADDNVISNGSCTTNCLAPVAHVLHEAYGIKRGTMTTVHAYTSGQPVHDRADKDFARARAANLSMVPTSTGAAKAIGLVLPHLEGKLFGTSIRVPTPNVSCVDLTVEVETATDVDAVNALFHAQADGPLKGVMDVEDRVLVSRDFNHWPSSATLVTPETAVVGGHMIRVLAWYDNEWGFSNRMLDVSRVLAAQ